MLLIDTFGAGGAERSTLELARYIVQSGEELIAVALKRRMVGVEEEFKSLDAKVYIGNTTTKKERLNYIVRIIRQECPDIVHSALFESNVQLRVARLFTPPFIIVQSLVSTPYVKERVINGRIAKVKFWLAKMLDIITARLSPVHFHAVSQTVADHHRVLFGYTSETCTVIPRGRRRNEMQHQVTRGNRMRLVNVGRMVIPKGQHQIIEALYLLRKNKGIENIDLEIYGREGTETDKLRRMIDEFGLGGQVSFMGFTDQIMDALGNADVFVMPSYFEGGAGALVEAMATGLPCICSDIPVLKEIIGEPAGAIFFTLGNTNELAQAIEKLYCNLDLRIQLSQAVSHRFKGTFDLDYASQQTLDLYYQLLK